MFAMSAKLVPVWSVTMPPSGIGVPVAATPGLVPHEEVLTAALAVELAEALLEEPPVLAGAELELELELLHAASMPRAIAATAAPATRERRREYPLISSAFSWLKRTFLNERWRYLLANACGRGGQPRALCRRGNGASLHCPCDTEMRCRVPGSRRTLRRIIAGGGTQVTPSLNKFSSRFVLPQCRRMRRAYR